MNRSKVFQVARQVASGSRDIGLPLSRSSPRQRPEVMATLLASRQQSTETDSEGSKPLQQLRRLRELVTEVDRTNSKIKKERIIAEYPDLEPLLNRVYDPRTRLHMTSITLRKHLWKRKADHEWQTLAAPQLARSTRRAATKSHLAATRDAAELEGDPACYPDLESLLGALSNREVTGGAALALVTGFLDHHGILQADRKEVHVQEFNSDISTEELLQGARNFPGLLQIFERVLDRNLKAGFSSRTVEAAYGRNIASEEQSSPSSLSTNATTASSEDNSGFATPARRSYPASMSAKFQVSLGKTVSRADLPRLFGNEDQRWFASRKLDGIRCLILLDFESPLPPRPSDDFEEPLTGASAPVLRSIRTLSRNGNEFTSLEHLKDDLASQLTACPSILRLLHNTTSGDETLSEDGFARLILDGEVCSLVRPSEASYKAARTGSPALEAQAEGETSDEGTSTTPGQEPEEAFVEDFRAIASGVMRKHGYQVPRPAFFPFDLLTSFEFSSWKSSRPPTSASQAYAHARSLSGERGRHRLFSERLKVMQEFVDWAVRNGSRAVRRLEQKVVTNVVEVEKTFGEAADKDWEGIILRLDAPYEGKRSASILKFKEWSDAEYVVDRIESARMRLPVDGVFADREALANVWVTHKGTPVSIGSGFTVEQRLRYHANPEEIIGKEITVEYFEESSSSSRTPGQDGSGELSLRFPRIKHVWENGRRET